MSIYSIENFVINLKTKKNCELLGAISNYNRIYIYTKLLEQKYILHHATNSEISCSSSLGRRYIVAGEKNGSLRVWRLEEKYSLCKFLHEEVLSICPIYIGGAGKEVFGTGSCKKVIIWEASSFTKIREIRIASSAHCLCAIQFQEGEYKLLVGQEACNVSVYDTKNSCSEGLYFEWSRGVVKSIKPCGRNWVIMDMERLVVYDLKTERCVWVLDYLLLGARLIDYGAMDSTQIFYCLSGGRLGIVDVATYEVTRPYILRSDPISLFKLSLHLILIFPNGLLQIFNHNHCSGQTLIHLPFTISSIFIIP